MGRNHKHPYEGRVSVILPTCNRYNTLLENVNNISNQDYKNLEIIICDDSDKKTMLENKETIEKAKSKYNYLYVARFDSEGRKDYGLARARNYGIIEATGQFLVFLDDRITPVVPNFISIFVEKLKEKPKTWFYGNKGADKQSFVENCSAIRKSEIVDAGMFCERIDKYGGMTREIHTRFTRQGFSFEYVPQALAKCIRKSDGWDKKEKEIQEMQVVLRKLWLR